MSSFFPAGGCRIAIRFCGCLVAAFLAHCPARADEDQPSVPTTFRWVAAGPLIDPADIPGDSSFSIKDPTIVRHQERWHLFCTVRSQQRSHVIVYLSFADWQQANRAPRHVLPMHEGYFCAPQVFYFRPHQKWYLICQAAVPDYQPAFATTSEISDPNSWTRLQPLGVKKPGSGYWLDFWTICDGDRAFLFYTCCNGTMWRCETSLDAFPRGWSDPVLALEGDIFEASHTYRIQGQNRFLTVVEAQSGHGFRYYKAYTAESLRGPWMPLAADKDNAFASLRNVDQSADHWTDAISHGELLRAGNDERMEIDASRLQFLFQGVLDRDRQGKPYGQIPWRLGLLRQAGGQAGDQEIRP
jgi:hypothetical protein